ncbi:MAG: hypothetical protein ABI569_15985, partial [Casimicrobiaceae bacterium]
QAFGDVLKHQGTPARWLQPAQLMLHVVPAEAGTRCRLHQSHWIPASAGMTRLFPIASTLHVLLSDIRVT